MRLIGLRLSNFRQHVDTRIDFAPGITSIIGPNGAGKSTLLEAIAWALYGMPAARGTRESIRAYRAPPRAQVRVELEFELGGHRYLVSRGLTGADVYLDGAAAPVASTISGATEFLRRRLGMSQQEFFHTYFTGQKELSVMAAMTPTERGQFLSRVLGYERLRTAQTLARDRRKVILAEADGVRRAMLDPEAVARAVSDGEAQVHQAEGRSRAEGTRRDAARAMLAAETPRWEAMQREREAVQALASAIQLAGGERAAADRDLGRIDRELADVGTARDELARLAAESAPLPALEAELHELERACNEDARRRTLAETHAMLGTEVARLRDRLREIERAPEREAELAAACRAGRATLADAEAAFENAKADWVRDAQEAETKRKALLAQLKEAEQHRDQIVELGENGPCPICTRPLETHFREVLDLFEEQIASITLEGKYWRARMEQLKQPPAEVAALDEQRRTAQETLRRIELLLVRAQDEARELRALAPDLTAKTDRRDAITGELGQLAVVYDAARHAAVGAQVNRLKPAAARASRLAAQLEREPQLVVERARAAEQRAEIERRTDALEARRAALAFSDEGFAAAQTRYAAAAAELHAAELAAVEADAALNTARGALETARRASDALARTMRQLAALDADRRLHDELDRAFGDLRSELNQELRPEISERASQYIRDLTDGRYSGIELDDQYNVTLIEDAIPKPVISGGEEDLANLVLRLAISEMIAERAGQAFSLLILDEVFGSLDEARRHNVVDLLRRLQDRFEQVVLITHIESVREGVDRVVTVRYDDERGISRVDADLAPALGLFEDALPQEGAAD